MKLQFALPMLALVLFASALKAEDAPKPDEVKPPDAAKPADAAKAPDATQSLDSAKPANTTDAPKAPEADAPKDNDSFVGAIAKGIPENANGKEMSAKKAAKKGYTADTLTLQVAGAKVKGDKDAKKHRILILAASGDVLTQLNTFAEKKAHVKVTGTVSGDTFTVKEVAEAPADSGKKKKNKDNV